MNSFGNKFRITLSGASHADFVAVSIEGVPVGKRLKTDDFTCDLLRRKSGTPGTTPRMEDDLPQFDGGVSPGPEGTLVTTGEPVVIVFANKDIRPRDYEGFKAVPRPGHADFTAFSRYGSLLDGFFSGRMTLPLVAAGVIAKKLVEPMAISARLTHVGGCRIYSGSTNPLDDPAVAEALAAAKAEGDSLGGIVECVCTGVPVGLGEPFFDSLESLLSHALFSIPGIRGVEFGDGFAASRMKGSEHNDLIADATGRTLRNGAGGINGGLSNGNPVVFRIAVKPTSSIRKPQRTFDFSRGEMAETSVPGRHDACFALRVPPVAEAMTAIVLANLTL